MTDYSAMCPVTYALSVIGGKWKPKIINRLAQGPLRTGELKRRLPGITQKMLTQQLRELEADGIVRREVHPVVPPHVEYSITELGWTLAPVMNALCAWGEMYYKQRQEKAEAALSRAEAEAGWDEEAEPVRRVG